MVIWNEYWRLLLSRIQCIVMGYQTVFFMICRNWSYYFLELSFPWRTGCPPLMNFPVGMDHVQNFTSTLGKTKHGIILSCIKKQVWILYITSYRTRRCWRPLHKYVNAFFEDKNKGGDELHRLRKEGIHSAQWFLSIKTNKGSEMRRMVTQLNAYLSQLKQKTTTTV